jgi:hypothetical protein
MTSREYNRPFPEIFPCRDVEERDPQPASSAPDVKKGFAHFYLGRATGGIRGGHSPRCLLGAKEGLRCRSFTAQKFTEIIWHGME